jgi:hypothetical protein
MSITTQLFKPLSTGESSTYFHQLCKKEVSPSFLINEYGVKGALIPIISWNNIWHTRIAGEISAQIYEDGKLIISPTARTSFNLAYPRHKLEAYRKTYQRAWSTMPIKSNKSFSHLVGACALDAITNTYTLKNIETLRKITDHLVNDGCFIEGSHYSLYCSDAYDRVLPLLENFYENDGHWVAVKKKMELLSVWQSNITSSDGVVASIGDSWYEKTNTASSDGTFEYKDMTIKRNNGWLVVANHRKTGFALHEHCHADEVLLAKDKKWIIQGSGMPSYKQVMAKPWIWRRPRNHFFSESKLDFYSLWRFRKKFVNTRSVDINKGSVSIKDVGKKTVRFPVNDNCQWSQGNGNLFFEYGGFSFVVKGDITNVKEDYAWQSIGYREEKKIKVLRVKGTDLVTIIQEK